VTSEPLFSERVVRSYELDSFGHVNNAVYLQYCEGARNDYLKQKGIRFSDFQRWNKGPFLYQATLNYKRPVFADDRLRIEGRIRFQRRTGFRIDHVMSRIGDEETVCIAAIDFAFVDLVTQKPCRVPSPFLEAFRPETQ